MLFRSLGRQAVALVPGQLEVRGGRVLFQLLDGPRARDRDDVPVRDHPGEGDLRPTGAVGSSDLGEGPAERLGGGNVCHTGARTCFNTRVEGVTIP